MVLAVIVTATIPGLSGRPGIQEVSDDNRIMGMCEQGLWASQPRLDALLSSLWSQETLDGQPSFLDDSPQWRNRADLALSLALRVAGETSQAQGGGQASAGFEGAVDAGTSETGASTGELWLISHYTAGANWGNTTYPFGSPTASGVPAQPGVVACGASYLGRDVVIAGWRMACADTGNPSYVYDGVADIWCEGESWGPTDPFFVVSTNPDTYAKDQWWYGLPCPAPCDQEIEGRCYAEVRVSE